VDPSAIALLSGLAGVALGAGAAFAARRSARAQAYVPEPEAEGALPAGAVDVLAALRSNAVVVDLSGNVVNSSPAAVAQGIVRRGTIAHEPLRAMARSVALGGPIEERDLELPRSATGKGRFHVRVRVAPLGAHHVVLLVEDTSAARRVEDVRRDFVANVSHELKTPVGGIALLAEAVEDAHDDPEAVLRFAGKMRKESDRLGRLVKEIVDLSRLQADAAVEDPRVIDVADVVREAVEHTRTGAELKQIELVERSPHGLGVYGHADLLVTAVRNLLSNAVTYSEPGTRVTVRAGLTPDGEQVEIAVTDQGAGIPEADQGRIFERFYRVDAARSRSTGGTGLGLAIVKHICENAGGEVSVWSEPDRGSTFTIHLPAVIDEPVPDFVNHQGETA
jgi:two-component system sensor histidine kinase SenX3